MIFVTNLYGVSFIKSVVFGYIILSSLKKYINLPWYLALWVLPLHFYALVFPPLAILVITNHHWSYLEETIDQPMLLYYAVGFLFFGSLLEVIQNSVDRWYLTADTASALQTSTLDGLFTFFIVVGQAMILLAMIGNYSWTLWLVVIVIAATPILYIKQMFPLLPIIITGLLNTIIGYFIFGDPIIFFQLVLAGMTVYFFNVLLNTGAQFFHGLTTVSASSGILFFIAAIDNAARQELSSPSAVMISIIAVSAILFFMWNKLNQTGGTESYL